MTDSAHNIGQGSIARQSVINTERVIGGPTICFENGTGAAKALTTNFADSSGTVWIVLPTDTQEIFFYLTTGGTAPDGLELQPRQSNDGGVAHDCAFEADNSLVASKLGMGPLYGHYEGQDGAVLPNDTYGWRLTRDQVAPDCTHIKLQVRRDGGDATTELYAEVVFGG